uniref:Transmembrane protein n=1 Tax=Ananas comosus var. bracteatus TaxID=296719 RepID=A0A6V7Q399_ANACO|nr:unnamed protein product [Ananas comosus var. bracteatus]
MGEAAEAEKTKKKHGSEEEEERRNGIVEVRPRARKGVASWVVDMVERVLVLLMHDSKKPLHYLSGNFAPVPHETPPCPDLPVRGTLPVSFSPFLLLLLLLFLPSLIAFAPYLA